jgi:predicted Fe-Mo cluster-binding NifX family protein
MILISLEADQQTISKRFRKADYFVFLKEKKVSIVKNEHKTSKSNEFFEYFKTLNIRTIYVQELGYKTFLKLQDLGVTVYFVKGVDSYDKITEKHLQKIDKHNAQVLCTLGHHR